MKKNNRNHIIKLVMASTVFVSSTRVQAIDLNTTTQNTDKSYFNTINSPYKFEKGTFFTVDYGSSSNPLVLKKNDGSITPLIQGLNVFELSFLFGMTDWLQLGILIPGENPHGIVGPYSDAKQYLNNILIEPKVYLMDGVAIIPLYYLPSSNSVDTEINGQKTTVPLGKEQGGYGAKMSVGFGDPKKDEVLTAVQIGAIMAPESKFREIDQTNRFQLNAGISVPLSGTIRLLVEAYAEKTKNNTPLESLASIEYRNDAFMLRLGGGGDLQDSGANTAKLLANFTYYFGDKKVAAAGVLGSPVKKEDDGYEKDERFKKYRNRKDNNSSPSNLENDEMGEQNGPTTAILTGAKYADNDLIIRPRSVPLEKAAVPIPHKPKLPAAQDVFIYAERRKSKEDFLVADDNNDEPKRNPASVDELNKGEEESTSTNSSYIEKRATINLVKAIQLIDYNLFLYKLAQTSNNKSVQESLKIELRWGIRVFNKNENRLKLIGKENHLANQVDLAQRVVDNKPVKFSEDVIKMVSAEGQLNVRSAPVIQGKNIVMKLKNLNKVIILGKTIYGDFVQIQVMNSVSSSPLFVSSKYLSALESDNMLIGKKEEYILNEKPVEDRIELKHPREEAKETVQIETKDEVLSQEDKAEISSFLNALNKQLATEEKIVSQPVIVMAPKEEKISVEDKKDISIFLDATLAVLTAKGVQEDELVQKEYEKNLQDQSAQEEMLKKSVVVEKKILPEPVVIVEVKKEVPVVSVVAPVVAVSTPIVNVEKPVEPIILVPTPLIVKEEKIIVSEPAVVKQEVKILPERKVPSFEELLVAPMTEPLPELTTPDLLQPIKEDEVVQVEEPVVSTQVVMSAPVLTPAVKIETKVIEIKAPVIIESKTVEKDSSNESLMPLVPQDTKSNIEDQSSRSPSESLKTFKTTSGLPKKGEILNPSDTTEETSRPLIKSDLPKADQNATIETTVVKETKIEITPTSESSSDKPVVVVIKEESKVEAVDSKEVSTDANPSAVVVKVQEKTTETKTVIPNDVHAVEVVDTVPAAKDASKIDLVEGPAVDPSLTKEKISIVSDEKLIDPKEVIIIDNKSAKVTVETPTDKLSVLKDAAEEDSKNKKIDTMMNEKTTSENELIANQLARQNEEKDRMKILKDEELKKIDAIMNKSSTSILVQESESDKKELPTPTAKSGTDTHVNKDQLIEQDGMQEQNGPSFDDL
jgi:hypothetical protein